MKFTSIILFLLIICLGIGCKKGNDPYAEMILSYQSSAGNYSESCIESSISNNLPLKAGASTGYWSTRGDSITIAYFGSLSNDAGNTLINIEINYTYAKTQLDSANGEWFVNNENDFINVFKGSPNILSSNNFQLRGVNLTLLLHSDTDQYSFLRNNEDTSNHFQITQASTRFDWYPLLQNVHLNPEGSFGIISVSANFGGNLINSANLYDTLKVSNGFYQGVFVDKN